MSIIAPNCQLIYKHIHQRNQISNQCCLFLLKSSGFNSDFKKTFSHCNNNNARIRKRSVIRASSLWPDLSKPSVVEMESINDCDHLDRVLDLARQNSQPIVIDWMANWCRKCIYLLPKLEKLAAEYDTKIKFYRVDVNNVPQSLVKRGNISKMPTIQLWKDGEMKAEVIGGHKAWLVMEEVREMIKQYI